MKPLILVLFFYIGLSTANNTKECFKLLHTISLTEQQQFYEMSLNETLNTSTTRNVFTCFLKASRLNDTEKVAAEKFFHIYELCTKFERKLPEPFEYKELNEFKQLGLQQSLFSYLNDGVISGNRKHIAESILDIKNYMTYYIETSGEYKDYRKTILKIIQEATSKQSQESKRHEEPIVRVAAFGRRSGQKSNINDKSPWQLSQLLSFVFSLLFLYPSPDTECRRVYISLSFFLFTRH